MQRNPATTQIRTAQARNQNTALMTRRVVQHTRANVPDPRKNGEKKK